MATHALCPLATGMVRRQFPSLTHWGREKHICVGKLTIIASDNGLSPGRRQAIIWTNAGILLIGPLGTNFSEILIGIHIFSFKKMRLKVSSAKWRPFWFGLNVLRDTMWHKNGSSTWNGSIANALSYCSLALSHRCVAQIAGFSLATWHPYMANIAPMSLVIREGHLIKTETARPAGQGITRVYNYINVFS